MSFDPNKKAEIAPKDEVIAVEPVIEKPRVPTLCRAHCRRPRALDGAVKNVSAAV
jgi:hypothetical protein